VLYAKTNPKHYHVRPPGIRFLVGHRDNTPWFGKTCPPECPGLGPDETFEPMELVWASAPSALRAAQ
jgi:hypothetical protein